MNSLIPKTFLLLKGQGAFGVPLCLVFRSESGNPLLICPSPRHVKSTVLKPSRGLCNNRKSVAPKTHGSQTVALWLLVSYTFCPASEPSLPRSSYMPATHLRLACDHFVISRKKKKKKKKKKTSMVLSLWWCLCSSTFHLERVSRRRSLV